MFTSPPTLSPSTRTRVAARKSLVIEAPFAGNEINIESQANRCSFESLSITNCPSVSSPLAEHSRPKTAGGELPVTSKPPYLYRPKSAAGTTRKNSLQPSVRESLYSPRGSDTLLQQPKSSRRISTDLNLLTVRPLSPQLRRLSQQLPSAPLKKEPAAKSSKPVGGTPIRKNSAPITSRSPTSRQKVLKFEEEKSNTASKNPKQPVSSFSRKHSISLSESSAVSFQKPPKPSPRRSLSTQISGNDIEIFLPGAKNSDMSRARKAKTSVDYGSRAPLQRNSTFATRKASIKTNNDDFGGIEIVKGEALNKRTLIQARSSGKLFISSKELTEWPESLWSLYEIEPEDVKVNLSADAGTWWEVVDLTRLVAADNQLTTVDPRISNFPTLTYMDLHSNKINSLPDEFGVLENLTFLSLASNELESVPKCILGLPITELHLERNKLRTLPSEMSQMRNLQQLDVSDNQIGELPAGIFSNMQCLKKLNLDRNKLRCFPSGMDGLVKLKELLVNENQLQTAWTESITLNELERLEMRKNQLVSFSQSAIQLPALQELLLSTNKLSSIGYVLCTCPQLQALDIRQNKFEQFPRGLFSLDKLKRLDIADNDIRVLAPELGLLSGLQALCYDGNPLRAIPRCANIDALLKLLRQRLTDEAEATEAVRQDLESARLEMASNPNAPIKVSEITQRRPSIKKAQVEQKNTVKLGEQTISTRTLQLEKMNLSQENPPLLPELSFEPSTVNISSNLYRELPGFVLDFTRTLSTLILCKNRLRVFPIADVVFRNLRNLDISQNQISEWPTEAAGKAFPELLELNMSRNKLSGSTPASLPFKRLQTLLLRGNQIQVLNADMCVGLHVLDAADNEIRHVPPELGKCWETMRHLMLEGNVFRVPRREVVEKGTDAVLQWLRDRME